MKTHLIFFFALVQIILPAQDVIELSGKDAGLKDFPKLNGFRNIDGILYKTDRENITRENRSVYHIERYGNDLTQKYSAIIEFPNERETVEATYFLDKEICLLSSLFNKDEHNLTLYLSRVDKETGKVLYNRKEVHVAQIDPKVKHYRLWFDVQLSEDKSKLAVLSNIDPRGEPCQRKVTVYEFPSMKQISQFELPGMIGVVNLLDMNFFYLSKDGILYYDYKHEVKKDDPRFRLKTVVAYNIHTKASKSKEFGTGSKKFEDGTPKEFQKGNMLYSVGPFAEQESKKEKKVGVFTKIIDLSDLDKSSINFEYFPVDIETKYSSRKSEFNEKNLVPIGIYPIDDGYYLVQNHRYEVTTSGQNTTYTKFYSKHYFISKFNYSGKREFIKVVPKHGAKNMYDEDIFENNGNLYLFYCDHPKNLEEFTLENFDPNDYRDVGDLRGPVPVCVRIKHDGSWERKTFEPNEEWCYFPGGGLKTIKGDGIIIYRVKENTYRLNEFRLKK
jgi:hypothetical protein